MTTQAKDCPSCGLTNRPSAMRCDCGYDFEAKLRLTAASTTSTKPPLPSWTKAAAGMALFQTVFTIALAFAALADGTFFSAASGFGLLSIADVVALLGLSIGVWHGHLWAAWALVAYSLLDDAVKVARTGQSAWIVPLVIYVVGALYLAQAPNIRPRFKELRLVRALVCAAVWVAGNFGIGFVFGRLGLLQNGLPRTDAIALAQLVLFLLWGICVFSLTIYRSDYPLEAVFLITLFALPLGIVDSVPRSWLALLELLAKAVWSLAIGMVACLLIRLSPTRATSLRVPSST